VRQLRRIIGYADLAQLVLASERDLDQQTRSDPVTGQRRRRSSHS
jgi:hypothetical protein